MLALPIYMFAILYDNRTFTGFSGGRSIDSFNRGRQLLLEQSSAVMGCVP